MFGPTNPASEQIHSEKYRGTGESFKDAMSRVANAMKDDGEHYQEFRDILLDMRFMPAGRVQAAMGSTKAVTAFNCYVSGNIEDSFVDGEGNIMQRATEAAATMRMGGGIGYDFSKLRPRGDLIKKLQSHSTGPISFMEIFDSVCRCIASAGHRRGAQMGVLRVDHPDIEEFIQAKHNSTFLTGFNVSVGITDHFMECLETGKAFPLVFGGETYREVDPEALWDQIMRSTYDWAEPGTLFVDRINAANNLWYCEEIVATNPCGEQPLPPFGACLLGSFNLVKYITRQPVHEIGEPSYTFDWQQFTADIYPVVRAMDNVHDRSLYPLPQQKEEAQNKRRMGLGITGLANAAEALGHPYGSEGFLAFEDRILETLTQNSYQASIEIAQEKGPFPLFEPELFGQRGFAAGLDTYMRNDIAKYGIRNSHLTSIAPTGTISFSADNVSSGIEPVFSYSQKRRINTPDGQYEVVVKDYGVENFGVEGKRTKDVTPEEHVDVLCMAAQNVDSAVSKTCNVPTDIPFEDFRDIYLNAYKGGAKGCTTYRPVPDGGRGAVLVDADATEITETVGESCTIDPATGKRDCS